MCEHTSITDFAWTDSELSPLDFDNEDDDHSGLEPDMRAISSEKEETEPAYSE